MPEPRLISPLLDGFSMGSPMSSHDGIICCPAIKENTDKKYIVKIISVPASQAQMDALLLAGAYKDPADAMNYFREMGEGILKEAELLIGETEPRKIAAHYLERGTKTVVVKLGPGGAYYACDNGDSGCVDGFRVEHVVDTVGAGDGFAAGVLSAQREGLSLDLAVQRGCAVGAIQVMSRGDNDGLPSREELDAFMAGQKDWRRHSA